MLSITEKEFDKLASYIHQNYGIHLTEKKMLLMTGRLSNLLETKHIRNYSDYYDYVVSDHSGQAVTELIDKITTNHTFFMREAEHFKYFGDVVLPYLKKTIPDYDLRIWSAGCSYGQEPYTLSMIIQDYFESSMHLWDTQLLATDISQKVLSKAIGGVYSASEIAQLPLQWKINYFHQVGYDEYEVNEEIKRNIVFKKFNLMDTTFPFKRRFHVIFCRNVMIYFDNKTKEELINKFYQMTEPGGYLFIGHSESLNRETTDYKYVMPAVYRKE